MLPCLLVASLLAVSHGLPDGLQRTPPMGWTSWNTFFEYNSEEKMISQVDALLDLELDKFGYVYLTIDDYWQLPERDNVTSRMIADPSKFPNGIRYISDYMHERGLKIGIYSSAGRYTCSGNLPGSLGFEEVDVEMLIDYDIDYFKYDNCYPQMDGSTNYLDKPMYLNYEESFNHFPSLWQDPNEESRYAPMAQAIQNAKDRKNITLELCAWGFGNVETFGNRMGHLWRTTADIYDAWESVLFNIDVNDEPRYRQEGVQGPDAGWNYPDGLFVGKGGMNDAEYRTMFALWCLVKSPLMLGSDLRNITKGSEAYKTITNTYLIEINQDPLGVQGECVKDCCSHGSLGGFFGPEACYFFYHSWQVWAGPLSDGFAVVVVNRFDDEKQISMNWQTDAKIPVGVYSLKNLWTGEVEGEITVGGEDWEGANWKGILGAHDNWAFRLTPVSA